MRNPTPISNRTEPDRRDINTEPVLYENERPNHIIGFSVVFLSDKKIAYQARRMCLTAGDVVKSKVMEMIGWLQDNGTADFNPPRDVLTSEQFKLLAETSSSLNDSPTGQPFRWMNCKGEVKEEPHIALLEINKPTLLVFTSNTKAIKYADFKSDYITPRRDRSSKLDPHCYDVRSWCQDTVLAFYSDFDPTREEPSEFWYNLVIRATYENPKGKVVQEIIETNNYDPGNGSGSGAGFP
ncbi:MAG: hypothetical protein ABJN69_01755 [Hellea sp.]